MDATEAPAIPPDSRKVEITISAEVTEFDLAIGLSSERRRWIVTPSTRGVAVANLRVGDRPNFLGLRPFGRTSAAWSSTSEAPGKHSD